MFRRRQFFTGTPAHDSERDDLDWYRPDGLPMTGQDWGAAYARAVNVALSGATGDHTAADDPFLIMLNAWWEPLQFTVPESLRGLPWQVEVDTSTADGAGRTVDPSAPVTLIGRSLVLLRSPSSGSTPSSALG